MLLQVTRELQHVIQLGIERRVTYPTGLKLSYHGPECGQVPRMT